MLRLEDEEEYLTPRQSAWRRLRYFYNAAIVNNGDLFSHLEKVDADRAALEEIGAVKTLAGADSLRELRAQYDALATDEEREALWDSIEAERDRAMEECDGLLDFADLLIRHAEAHPQEFPEGRDRLAEMETWMRERAEQTEEEKAAEKERVERGMEELMKDRGPAADGWKELLNAKGEKLAGMGEELKRFTEEFNAAGGLDELRKKIEERRKDER